MQSLAENRSFRPVNTTNMLAISCSKEYGLYPDVAGEVLFFFFFKHYFKMMLSVQVMVTDIPLVQNAYFFDNG